jgi:hypothetical protein
VAAISEGSIASVSIQPIININTSTAEDSTVSTQEQSDLTHRGAALFHVLLASSRWISK